MSNIAQPGKVAPARLRSLDLAISSAWSLAVALSAVACDDSAQLVQTSPGLEPAPSATPAPGTPAPSEASPAAPPDMAPSSEALPTQAPVAAPQMEMPATAPGEQPLYALLTQVYGVDDDRTVYISLSNTLDVGNVDLTRAREFAGVTNFNAIGGRILVSSGQVPAITEYEITEELQWVEGRTLGFQSYPLTDNANWYYQFVLNDNTAYLPFEGYKRVVWDPTEMTITSTMEDGTLPPVVGSLLLEAGGNRNGIRYSNAVYQAFFYHDQDWFRFGADSVIISYDPVTHRERSQLAVPCPGLAIATADEAGNTYFSSWDYLPGLALYGEGPAPCAARLRPDGTLDEAWTTDFTGLTGGRYVTNFRYVGGGRAVANVLHAEEMAVDFSQPMDPEVVSNLYQSGPHWHFWLFDLNTQTARPVEGVNAEIGSSAQFAVLDGRTFVFLPYEQYSRSKIYEIDATGRATEHVDVLGDVFKWVRVR